MCHLDSKRIQFTYRHATLHNFYEHLIHKTLHTEHVNCMLTTLQLKSAQNNLALVSKMRKHIFLKKRYRKPSQKQMQSLEAEGNLLLPLLRHCVSQGCRTYTHTRLLVSENSQTQHPGFFMLLFQLHSLFKSQRRTICNSL